MLCPEILLIWTASLKETRRGLPWSLEPDERRAEVEDLRELLRGDADSDSMTSSRSLRDRWCTLRVPDEDRLLLLGLPPSQGPACAGALRALELFAFDSPGLRLGMAELLCCAGLLSLPLSLLLLFLLLAVLLLSLLLAPLLLLSLLLLLLLLAVLLLLLVLQSLPLLFLLLALVLLLSLLLLPLPLLFLLPLLLLLLVLLLLVLLTNGPWSSF